MLRLIRWSAVGLIVLLALAWGIVLLAVRAPDGFAAQTLNRAATLVGFGVPRGGAAEAVIAGGSIGGPFTLTDQLGRSVTDADFRGRWMLVYFGYTYCPDVCPTTLQTIAGAMDALGPDAAKIVPVFVTIDPARDTPKVLASYVKLFDPRLVGLTGTPDQIAAVAHAYHVYYARVPGSSSNSYAMDHSSFIYLMDPQGRFVTLFRPDSTAGQIAAGIARRLHDAE